MNMGKWAIGTLLEGFKLVARDRQSHRVIAFLLVNVFVCGMLFYWCHITGSKALTAFTYLTVFDAMHLMTCLLTMWVKKQKPSPAFSFGYERLEVLAVFASTMLAILGAFFIFKESVEHLFMEHVHVHTGRLLQGIVLALAYHMAVTCLIHSPALDHVSEASSSSWLQEQAADMCGSLCNAVPGLTRLLLPRVNPLALLGWAAAAVLLITDLSLHNYNYYAADMIGATMIAFMTIGTMFPMSSHTGKILLQTTPGHVLTQLDKCLRETSTLDGVLEFRNEHFWTLSFGSMAGSLDVRVRRDADHQLVLAHVVHRLSSLVSTLTVNVFKDDWVTRAAAHQIIGGSNPMSPIVGGADRGFATSTPRPGQPPGVPAPVPDLLSNVSQLPPSSLPGHSHAGHGHSHAGEHGHSHGGHGHSHGY